MSSSIDSLDFATLRRCYRAGTFNPVDLIRALLERIERRGDDKVWIYRLPREEVLAAAEAVARYDPKDKPLFGIPFAIKDNIDLAGHPTTAGCPDFAYAAAESAPVVAALIAAGAIPLGKTNLDQFATGLNGTRSPYGACASPFDPAYISGGSSSGSAVAVAAGLASFALGTDTAGSGRVPAAFNNIFGLKPTRGRLSSRGVVPACRSLDCISIFTLTAEDAEEVLAIADGFDAADPFSRTAPAQVGRQIPRDMRGCRFGVPRTGELAFFGNEEGRRLFDQALALVERLGGHLVEIDFSPFLEVARLLYEGPWIAERYAAIRQFIEEQPDAIHPVVREIIAAGARPLAADAFAAYYRLKALRRETDRAWERIDVLITPTAGRTYTIKEVLAAPVQINSDLGYYTNFMNLLDLSALAVPAGFQTNGLPFGVTLAAPAFQDEALCQLGGVLQRAQALPLGALGFPPASSPAAASASKKTASAATTVRVAVCGAHMSGLPLNHELAERQGQLVRRCLTAPRYRMFALTRFAPIRPGLLRLEPGRAVEVEVWEMPVERFGSFVAGIPGPLGIGTVELEDGERVHGFVCEPYAIDGAEDISELGGWRRYLDGRHTG